MIDIYTVCEHRSRLADTALFHLFQTLLSLQISIQEHGPVRPRDRIAVRQGNITDRAMRLTHIGDIDHEIDRPPVRFLGRHSQGVVLEVAVKRLLIIRRSGIFRPGVRLIETDIIAAQRRLGHGDEGRVQTEQIERW